jgi:hypothetical protein
MEEEIEKTHVLFDTDPQIARLIIETAEYLGKCLPADWKDGDKVSVIRTNPALVKEAADLVFLAMSLILEKRGE